MRKIVALFAFAISAALIFTAPPAAAFGLRIGPFHIGIPFGWHRRHHPLYMHANPYQMARSEAGRSEPRETTAPQNTVSPALVYPSLALPVIFQNVFWPNASQWPFGYQNIFTTAFAKLPTERDEHLCQQPFDANAMIGRINSDISPTPEQTPLLQKLGGALGMASGYLAKACPAGIPAQPVARLQMMQSQIQALAMAIDIVRPPLQAFEQSLTPDQKARFDGAQSAQAPAQTTVQEQNQAGNLVRPCGNSTGAIDWSIEQINKSVQPTDAQRDDLAGIKQSLNAAAADLDGHCPATAPATALGRLETIEARLDAAWRTVLSMQVALANFEAKLTDAQKSRFDTMNVASR
ncbi:MAG TPA: Spy/CpxP family protein refolding chaperone [Xanthobacteraceae bacterium]|nr:Spy/CpxP family protein refolding chaperone [Xanthobacteraceae bacterium]